MILNHIGPFLWGKLILGSDGSHWDEQKDSFRIFSELLRIRPAGREQRGTHSKCPFLSIFPLPTLGSKPGHSAVGLLTGDNEHSQSWSQSDMSLRWEDSFAEDFGLCHWTETGNGLRSLASAWQWELLRSMTLCWSHLCPLPIPHGLIHSWR